jgi:hypothetical protein
VRRKAKVSDVDAICRSLPEVELGTSWGDLPTYLVRQKPKPRGFVLARAPRHDAVDPETGEEYQDLLVIRTADPADKAALVEADGPFFTIDHFRGYNGVLVQQSRLGEIDVDELREVLTDAWLAVAPKSLAKRFLAGLDSARPPEASARPPEASARPPEASARPPEASARPPEASARPAKDA